MRCATLFVRVGVLASCSFTCRAFLGARIVAPLELRSARASTTAIMALKGMARKAKEAEVSKDMESLRSSSPDSPVFKILEQVEADGGGGDGPQYPLSSLLRKNVGTLSVVAEYRKILKSGFIDGILAPELLCPLFRNGGASCVSVATEKLTGGCTDEDMDKIVAEEEKIRGDFPGPMPVIVRDLVISEFQIARAKASGALGVTIPLTLVGDERAAELCTFSEKLGMEAVVQTTSQEEIEQAVSIGASIVSVVGKTTPEAVELKQYIPDKVLSIVHVDRRSDEGLVEVEDCWKLRDAGYNTIWASEVLYKGGQIESAEAMIKSIRAKASTQFASARAMSGKGEGAKEYLGYLSQ